MSLLDTRPKAEVKDFIYIKKNSITESFCEHVIKKFNKDPRKGDGVIGFNAQRVDKTVKDTKDIHISTAEGWEDEDKIFFDALGIGLQEYSEYVAKDFQTPHLIHLIQDIKYKSISQMDIIIGTMIGQCLQILLHQGFLLLCGI